MCMPADAELPDVGLPFPLSPGRRLVLTSADSSTFAAHLAAASEPTGTGVVVLPDIRGLFSFYERLAEAFAASGYDAVALDYFGRTAGTEPRDADWESRPHVAQVQPEQLSDDVAAAIEHLRTERGVDKVMTVGFCMGGAFSLRQALAGHDLSGVVSFYGTPAVWRDTLPSVIERADAFECKVLGLYGGDDRSIPADAISAFDRALTDAGVEHDLHIYPGAPHSFFDRSFDEWSQECRDAWRRLMAFAAT